MFVDQNTIDLRQKEQEFLDKVYCNPEVAEDVAVELFSFFQPLSYFKDWENRLGYFRWYTMLTWRRLNRYSPKFVIEEAVRRQIPMALICDIDVRNELLWFLIGRAWIEEEMKTVYADMKNSFLNSGAIVGITNGSNVLVKDLIVDIKKLSRTSITSLEKAEINTKIKQCFFSQKSREFEELITVKPETVVERFIELVEFFLEVEPEGIQKVVDKMLHPNLGTGNETTEQNAIYSNIKRIVDKKFMKEVSGQYIDTQGVLVMLDGLSQSYNDNKIRELYVFNEKSGSFEWNNDLLTK